MRQEYKSKELSVLKCGGGYNSTREGRSTGNEDAEERKITKTETELAIIFVQ
jgi:hypothetical protein